MFLGLCIRAALTFTYAVFSPRIYVFSGRDQIISWYVQQQSGTARLFHLT